jgi:hypothetical protein
MTEALLRLEIAAQLCATRQANTCGGQWFCLNSAHEGHETDDHCRKELRLRMRIPP